MAVTEVMEKFLEGQTLRSFAEALTQSVRSNLTHASIHNWRRGKQEPETDFLLQCLIAYSDWRQDWALEMLQAKLPEVFDDGTLCQLLMKGVTR